MAVRATATLATALITTAAATALAVGADGSGEPSAREEKRALPTRPPIGEISGTLSRLDPLTLKPRGERLELPEFHDAWSFSPDGSRVALGMGSPSARPCGAGICIVDLASMRVIHDIDAPIAAEAVGWVSPRLVVAVLQSGQVFVADPVTGKPLPGDHLGVEALGPISAATPEGFAALIDGDPSKLATFDRAAQMRVADLDQVVLGRRESAGLAVDPAGSRAFVIAAGAPAAEVDLETMEVSYEPVITRSSSRGAAGRIRARIRCAGWLDRGLVAVDGADYVRVRSGLEERPAGVEVIDTETWEARTVNRQATRSAYAAGRLLAWRPGLDEDRGIGLRIYSRSGRRLVAHLFGDETLSVKVAGGYVYAIHSNELRVVHVRTGKVVHRSERRGARYILLLSSNLGGGYACGGSAG